MFRRYNLKEDSKQNYPMYAWASQIISLYTGGGGGVNENQPLFFFYIVYLLNSDNLHTKQGL
jgi:hypothetical protein